MDILLCVVGGIMTSVACLELVLQPESSSWRENGKLSWLLRFLCDFIKDAPRDPSCKTAAESFR